MSNKVLFEESSIDALTKGMSIVHKAVSKTMGASGGNVIFRENGKVSITNDGVTIAKRINLEDEAEAMGADYLKQAAERSNEEAGDGTTTAIVLAYHMAMEGLRKIKGGINPMRLRREMNESLKKIVEKIKNSSRQVETDEELFNIANISVEDKGIATIVRDAVKRAGPDGTVIVDESTGTIIEKEEIDGLKFDRGYISPYMVTNPNKMEAVLHDIHILITDKNLNLLNDFFPLWENINSRGIKKLLIIAEDVSGEVLASMIASRFEKTSNFLTVCVKRPYNADMLDDIAVLTGAIPLTTDKGISKLDETHFNCLGMAKKVVVTKDSTLIIGGGGNKEKIDERITSIKNELKTAENYEKIQLKHRLAKLIGGVVIIKVGAPTEADMKYLKRKVDDAVGATQAAMEEGIVVGGGRMLYDISLETPENDGDAVIKYACGQCIRTIINNAGEDSDKILSQLKEGEIFNAFTGTISSDPIKDGIVDPAKVERCSLTNAVSFASTFLTSHGSIIEIPEKDNGSNMSQNMV